MSKLPYSSPNFGFLEKHSELLVRYAAQAERYLFDDPNTALIKLRQFAELLANLTAARMEIYVDAEDSFLEVLRRLSDRGVFTPQVREIFHSLRMAGNDAVHAHEDEKREALHQLRMAWKLGIWFQKLRHPRFRPDRFITPPEPVDATQELLEELEQAREQAEQAALNAEQAEKLKQAAQAEAKEAYEELKVAMELAQESEEQLNLERTQLHAQLTQMQVQAVAEASAEYKTDQPVDDLIKRALDAGESEALDLNEADTRRLIDAQLRETGWEVDTRALTYEKGARPQKGKDLAIAEWPTASGPADYVLFVDLSPLAVVEAKRERKDVAGAIGQAKRYSRDYTIRSGEKSPAGPWGDYKIPFMFATNGRPFLRQFKTKSGIWFLDGRLPTNHSRPLEGWYTPEGLTALLGQDFEAAQEKLDSEPTDYLGLWDFQLEAIAATEQAIVNGQREILIAMATGTGKTRTSIGLVYRLIKSGRFRRVLFLVDRSALGEQAGDAFKDVRLENLQSFNDIYDVKELGDLYPDPDTRLHIATIQGMVKRVLYANDELPLTVDQYDCVIIDECHRGYTLDREISDSEITFRDEKDYISKYRRVLDHFDAIRIGLTATPALHTTEIFGDPVYTYSYRQAVIDGYLIDHEPPVRLVTALAEQGITWEVGEEVPIYDPTSGQIDLLHAPDEITFEIESFNKRVITENFNKVVCRELAKQIDPSLPGKTLIFCANDNHADMVVDLLKKEFATVYGEIEDDAVAKITGSIDRPSQTIRRYKNERLPSVAVTVDLLTTGIDVREIVNLVFIRRVRSRILYEQMLGRATRLCPEIGKERFIVYDAVDLYSALEPYTSMKPVVSNPAISFSQLVEELEKVGNEDARRGIQEQFVAKLQSKKRVLKGKNLDEFETLAGMNPKQLIDSLRNWEPSEAVAWFAEHPDVAAFLDKVTGDGSKLIISEHEDKLLRTERGYGAAKRPEDYLDSFKQFINDNLNKIPALIVVTQRPRDLTRQQLKELKLELDRAGYSETALRTAWRETTNEDIAASIIGYIRRMALGSPLVPYEERVTQAMKSILASRQWTPPQRQWLERIGKQLLVETIVDRDALDRGQFKARGGFQRINKVFDGKLEQVLHDVNEELWRDTA